MAKPWLNAIILLFDHGSTMASDSTFEHGRAMGEPWSLLSELPCLTFNAHVRYEPWPGHGNYMGSPMAI